MLAPSPPSRVACRGRFAPSPTGPLHFGSLVAALASCLDARTRGGEWLVRMEDVDAPRNVPGAAESILACLEAHGFAWDGPVLWQSARLEAYRAVLDELLAAGLAYGCACSRREIADRAGRTAVDGGLLYPGTCRPGLAPGRQARAWRLRVSGQMGFADRLQGWQLQDLERDVGDFVLFRADGQFAYQLAVVVDDAFQGITDVVRGADLLDSTPRQIFLQSCLGYPQPVYAHLPVVTNGAGEKLSKQTRAPALVAQEAAANLVEALAFLGQQPPPELMRAGVDEVWAWAREHWDFARIPRCRGRVRQPGSGGDDAVAAA
ncbi:tRNA glutamyl-Q(34) synthetase GluQRS [Azovibrio restrictus]|uniref:tRNA glutamyl-Q(34) synthetase GluQRS n=1 Tax=Azovibrio restrictus TaxID=146938 RepID=UPI0026E959C2|nr:tRNA glutamyl-Q(34) synthetase GluQRS [Azovibrio restrictus]